VFQGRTAGAISSRTACRSLWPAATLESHPRNLTTCYILCRSVHQSDMIGPSSVFELAAIWDAIIGDLPERFAKFREVECLRTGAVDASFQNS